MPAEPSPDHHARRRERRRRVKQLRRRPLADLNLLPCFLTEAPGPSSDAVTATAAELGPLLDGAGYKVPGQPPIDAIPEAVEGGLDPSLRGSITDCEDGDD